MSRSTEAIMAAAGQYRLRRVELDSLDDALAAQWQAFQATCSDVSPMQDAYWLQGYFDGQLADLSVYMIHERDFLRGVVPILRKDWPLIWHLGELAVARPPLRRLRMLGTPSLPENEGAYDLLFSELARTEHAFDAIQLEEVSLDSFLWKYLQTSPQIRRSFRLYVPDPPLPHTLLRFRGSFDEYMAKFSRKHRHELRREVRRIQEGALGEMRFVRYTAREEVPLFLEPEVEVSRKTYQWRLHGRGLSSTDLLRRRFQFAAGNGWFRSYLLYCGDRPTAFLAGFQYRGLYLPLEMGFDPELSKYSVGTVLQLLAVEDMFAHETPDVLDLGGYGTWKDVLSTDTYLETKVLLFCPGAYTRFVKEGHRLCRSITAGVSAILDRVQYKSKLKRFIRRFGGSR